MVDTAKWDESKLGVGARRGIAYAKRDKSMSSDIDRVTIYAPIHFQKYNSALNCTRKTCVLVINFIITSKYDIFCNKEV